MSTSRPSQRPLDLDITIVSAKHLKNVNWRNGPLKPYVIFWTDPDRRLATKSDDSGSTRPVWNEQFILPLTLSPLDSTLTLEIFHSKPLESAKPLVGILRFPIRNLVDSADSDEAGKLRTFELRRPSGRPQGKIRLKLSIKERVLPDYQSAPQGGYYYSSAPPLSGPRGYPPVHSPPPPPPAPYGYVPDPYSGYYPSYYTQQQALPPPPPSPRPYYDTRFTGAPSAPVDYAPPRPSRMGVGSGVAMGAVAGALGGLALEEGLKYEEEKIAERVETDVNARDEYRDYRSEY
ncbi:hypothetical protein ACET3Z_011964 [Daucus carota]